MDSVKAIFANMADASGNIRTKDLKILFVALNFAQGKIDLFFREMDASSSGVVQFDQFITWIQENAKGEGPDTASCASDPEHSDDSKGHQFIPGSRPQSPALRPVLGNKTDGATAGPWNAEFLATADDNAFKASLQHMKVLYERSSKRQKELRDQVRSLEAQVRAAEAEKEAMAKRVWDLEAKLQATAPPSASAEPCQHVWWRAASAEPGLWAPTAQAASAAAAPRDAEATAPLPVTAEPCQHVWSRSASTEPSPWAQNAPTASWVQAAQAASAAATPRDVEASASTPRYSTGTSLYDSMLITPLNDKPFQAIASIAERAHIALVDKLRPRPEEKRPGAFSLLNPHTM